MSESWLAAPRLTVPRMWRIGSLSTVGVMANKPKYKTGDLVRLRSGGPEMTIGSVPKDALEDDYYICLWFDGEHRLKEKILRSRH